MPAFRWILPTLAITASTLFAADAPKKAAPKANAQPNTKSAKSFFGDGVALRTITFSEALQSALKHNLDSKIEEIGVLIRDAQIRDAYGDFDPVFSFAATRSYAESPSRNDIDSPERVTQIEATIANSIAIQQNTNELRRLQGLPPLPVFFDSPTAGFAPQRVFVFEQETDRGELNLQARTPLGTILTAGVRAQRIRNAEVGNSDQAVPSYTALATVEARQPLLKGFGFDANLVNIRISRKNKEQQELAWKFRIERTLQSVVTNYYNMQASFAQIENKAEAIRADMKFVENIMMRKQLGLSADSDIEQAKVQMLFDKEEIYPSKNNYLQSQYDMQRLILPKHDEGQLAVLLPVNIPSLKVPLMDREALRSLAYEKRYDYKSTLIAVESEDLRIKFAKNQRLPQLDIVGSYGWNGIDNGYNEAINNTTHSQGLQWQLGVTGSFPVGGIQPRAQLDAARARKEQSLLQLRAIELQIGLDVDAAVDFIKNAQTRLDVARQTTKSALVAVKADLRKFEEGQATVFEVIEQQRRYNLAKDRELIAEFALNQSIINLWFATGTVQENLGIISEEEVPKAKVLPKAVKKK
jgi:outer membrane protein